MKNYCALCSRYHQSKKITEPQGKFASRNALQTYTLLDVIEEFKFDALIGGARRDEEKARAKERIFRCVMNSVSGTPNVSGLSFGIFTMAKFKKEKTFARFPSATDGAGCMELHPERRHGTSFDLFRPRTRMPGAPGSIDCPLSIYQNDEGDKIVKKKVRYRTVGDMTCTAAVESAADTLDEIINEIIATKISERGETRIDDKVSEAAMEDRKKSGYF